MKKFFETNKKYLMISSERNQGEHIIEYISKPYETLLDQYAGSGNFVIACYNKKRNGIAIEKSPEMFNKMKDNIEGTLDIKFEEIDYEY